MSIYNTPADAANTAVRAYLTKIGEYYRGCNFNTGSGKGQKDWQKIKNEIFNGECAYCGTPDSNLQMEHLIMFNRTDFGLHHPGNIVPVCKKCNSRSKKENGNYNNWEDHLSYICEINNARELFHKRWNRIRQHQKEGEFAYPELSKEERESIRIIANNLYEKIKAEFENSITLYKELDKTFTKG